MTYTKQAHKESWTMLLRIHYKEWTLNRKTQHPQAEGRKLRHFTTYAKKDEILK